MDLDMASGGPINLILGGEDRTFNRLSIRQLLALRLKCEDVPVGDRPFIGFSEHSKYIAANPDHAARVLAEGCDATPAEVLAWASTLPEVLATASRLYWASVSGEPVADDQDPKNQASPSTGTG